MKTVLITVLGVLLLASAGAFATETRTMVMGQNHMIVVDDYNMFMFPGRVNNYPNLALGDFWHNDGLYDLGITWQFNEDKPWVLGTFVAREPEYGPRSFWGDNLANFPWYNLEYYPLVSPSAVEQAPSDEPRRFEMLYGRQLFGQNFGFSFDLVRYSWESKQDSTSAIDTLDIDASQSFHQFTFGLGLTEATSGQWDVSVHFMTGGWTNKNMDGDKLNEPSGFYDLGMAARYFWVRSPKITFVPHVQAGIGKRGVKDFGAMPDTLTTDDTKDEYSRTAFDIGFGMNYTPGPDMLAVIDFGFAMESVKVKYSGDGYTVDQRGEEKETYLVFPYMKLGFEGEVFSWMDVRAGGITSLWTSKDKWESDFEVDETWDDDWVQTYLGLGFHWGRLYLDTYMDPQIVTEGFNFISGTDFAAPMNWSVSMVYEMF